MIGRWIPVVGVTLGLAAGLASCSSFSGYVADHWPHWAGGMPADVPPRPGAPGYADFIAHGQAAPDATTNTLPAPQFTTTSGAQAGTKVTKPASKAVAVRSGSTAAPPAMPQSNSPRNNPPGDSGAPESGAAPDDDASTTRGGLY